MGKDQVKYLISVICIISASLLAVLYFLLLPTSTLKDLILQVIPNALFALTAIPVIYFLLEKRGILTNGEASSLSSNDLETLFVRILSQHLNNRKSHPSFVEFFPCWMDIDWKEHINNAKSIEIIIPYFSNWVADYELNLIGFLNSGGKIKVILSSPDDQTCVSQVRQLYPQDSPETIKQKILLTFSRFEALLKKSTASAGMLEIYFFNGCLNYCAVKFDNERLFLGFFEHFRELRVKSSAFLLDLRKSKRLEAFWKRQYEEFLNNSAKQNLS